MNEPLLSPFTGKYFDHPEPVWAGLRAVESPIRVTTPEGTAWVLASHRDVLTALSHPDLSTCDAYASGEDYKGYSLPPKFHSNIINVAPERHAALRKVAASLMDSRTAKSLEFTLRSLANELLTSQRNRPTIDLVNDYAIPYVTSALATWLGFKADHADAYHQWSRSVGPLAGRDAARRSRDTFPFMERLIDDLLTSTTTGNDTVVSRLLHGCKRANLTGSEVAATLFYLVFALHDVCVNAVSMQILHLSSARESSAIRAQVAPVDEVLRRFTPQTFAYRRFATRDVHWGRATIKSGQSILACLASANTDPRAFANPLQVQPGRSISDSLAFGHGSHRCPGRNVARTLVTEAAAPIRRSPRKLDVSDVRWTRSLRARGPYNILAHRQ